MMTPQNLHTTLMSLQLLIFDLDGTLIDSRFDLADAVNHAMKKLDKPAISYEQLPGLLGSGLNYLLETAASSSDKSVLQTARKHFDEYYEAHYVHKTRPYPGVQSTLSELSKKLQLAVYSNKLQYFTTKVVEGLDLAPFFDIIQGAAPERYPLKPHPAGIQRIIKQLGISATNTMMIGDSTHDIEAGKAAGVKTCAVTYGYRQKEILKATAPDNMISRFEELLDII